MNTQTAATATARCPFGHGAAAPKPSLADALRERTKEAHASAERHPLQVRLVQGAVKREEYAAYLGQLLHVWREIDAGLAALAARDARVAGVLQPHHAHAARVEADLAFLGSSGAAHTALPATARWAERLRRSAASDGAELLGSWYVLEGSANGGRFIAKAIARALGIAGPDGLRNFDPHGEHQRERWQAWRAAVDAQRYPLAEQEAIINAARSAFVAVHDLMEELCAQPPVPQSECQSAQRPCGSDRR